MLALARQTEPVTWSRALAVRPRIIPHDPGQPDVSSG